jgi:hypothetical protein
MAALFGSPALGQFSLHPARCTIKFIGGRDIRNIIQLANVGENTIATAQKNANIDQCCDLTL